MKTKSLLRKYTGYLSLGVASFVLFMGSSFAVGVKPLRTEIVLEPGQSETATIKVINDDRKMMKVEPSVEVYLRNDENGMPVSVELNENDPRNISSWIEFSEEETVLEANSEKEVSFTITAPDDAEPGGKYASIIYEEVIDDDEGVQVRAQVGSLILVNIAGDEQIEGELSSFSLDGGKIYSDQPVTLAVGFKNTGNVHIKPQGEISLKDAQGKELKQIARYTDPQTGEEITADTIPVNIEGGNVLPDSTRNFKSDWSENVQEGQVTATLDLEYAGEEVQKELAIDTTSDLAIESFDIKHDENGADFVLVLKNNGKIYEKPMGSIEVFNEFETSVAKVELPEDAEYVAPGETKEITLNWLTRAVKDGTYSAKIKLEHGLAGTEVTDTIGFVKDPIRKEEAGDAGFLSTPAGMVVLGGFAVLVIIILFLLVGKKGRK